MVLSSTTVEKRDAKDTPQTRRFARAISRKAQRNFPTGGRNVLGGEINAELINVSSSARGGDVGVQ